MAGPNNFNFEEAFSRNIGWVTDWEQQVLRSKRVAIAGVGGVGGIHLLTLARLGISHFNIADLDRFELANFNRQAGAMVSTIDKEKVDVMEQMARDINPQLDIKVFHEGVTPENLDDFLKDVDLYVDGLDAFVLDMRAQVFKRAYELGIPAVTAGPLGMATIYMAFMPGQMTFEEYFGLEGQPFIRQAVNFLFGLSPKSKHFTYLVDRTKVNIKAKKGPSTPMACQLAAGVVGAQALKILLNRGKVYAAPWSHCFDPYLNRWVLSKLSGGRKNILQNFKNGLAYKVFAKKSNEEIQADPLADSVGPQEGNELEQILDIARWSPSGDNIQPWRFQIINDEAICVHFSKEDIVYNYGAHASFLSIGILLENFKIAAAQFNRDMSFEYKPPTQWPYAFTVTFKRKIMPKDPLFPFIKVRSVNRGHYQFKALTEKHKNVLQDSLGDGLQVQWQESLSQRLDIARMTALSTHIRLSIKEAFQGHKEIIDWKNTFSPDKIPIKAVGFSESTQKVMAWAMQDWSRVNFLNKYLAGTLLPQIELDYVPAIYSSAYFIITSKGIYHQQDKAQALMAAGRQFQRFWLTLTQLGLSMQPAYASLALSWFAKNGEPLTEDKAMQEKTKKLLAYLEKFVPIQDIVFIGRIGYPKSMYLSSRSIRKPVADLLQK